MLRNNNRFDLSDYLVHFFRDIKIECCCECRLGCNNECKQENSCHFNCSCGSDAGLELPEEMLLFDVDILPAFYMFREALRSGRLWATWSYRNGLPTIYGDDPAICFTNMPITAFLLSSTERHQRRQKISSIGLCFPKKALFNIGTRPVIYGTSSENDDVRYDAFNAKEQYRYVNYVAGRIDWTHEREWRWPCRSDQDKNLSFYNVANCEGSGIIVETRAQADVIIKDILTLIDSGKISSCFFSFIVIRDEVLPNLTRINQNSVSYIIENGMIDLEAYYSYRNDQLPDKFLQFIRHLDPSIFTKNNALQPQEKPWLWLFDNKNLLTRSLIFEGLAFITKDGRYLVDVQKLCDNPSFLKDIQNFDKLVDLISEEFSINCCRFSVTNSNDPMSIPNYVGGLKYIDTLTNFYNSPDRRI